MNTRRDQGQWSDRWNWMFMDNETLTQEKSEIRKTRKGFVTVHSEKIGTNLLCQMEMYYNLPIEPI